MGERVFNLQRIFNVMLGFTRDDDYLPERFYKELLKEGPPKDIPMTREAFEAAMDEYYEYRGWDSIGRPTVIKLIDLKIEDKFITEYRKATGL